jgi:ubiquinone/menaquinone biosynthesis C-methylase UbiE
MGKIKIIKKYKTKDSYLVHFLKEYWYIPSDVLQRSIEANAWDLCEFKKPVLDIGIGNGRMSNYIFRNSPRIDVGIDSEKSGLDQARKTKKYKEVVHANAESLPFKDSSFNTVVSNSTFEHIKGDFKAVSEAARVLKKRGMLYLTVPSIYLQNWILEYESNLDYNQSRIIVARFNKRANHLHYRSLEEWTRYFKDNNLELVFQKYYFPKSTAVFWYKLFKKFTSKFGKREAWSIIGNSKATKFIPKSVMVYVLKNILKDVYRDGFFMESGVGAQMFMVAKKM